MLVKEAIIEFFHQKNIAHIFHLPGIHTLPLNQELEKSNIAVFSGRHESNCAFMADGYARASGKVGVVIVTPGPGLGNIVAACMEAYGDGVPLLILHIDSNSKRRGTGVLHEITNPETIFFNCAKAIFSVSNPGALLTLLETACETAANERCGPVVVSIPHDLFEKQVSLDTPIICSEKQGQVTEEGISELEKALWGKERPVMIGGRALMRAGLAQEIEDLCSGSSIPFLTTTSAKGFVREDLFFSFGNVIAHGVPRRILSQADAVIALGTRLRDADARRRGVKLKDIVHIDVDDQWIGKNYVTRLSVVSRELSMAVEELTRIFKDRRSGWDLKALKAQQTKEREALRASPGYAISAMLRSVIPKDTITVWDLNLISYWAEYYFPVLKEGTFITPRGTSPIFYAVPAAIGAKIAKPEQPCLCVTGDGSCLPTLSELAVVRKHNLPIVFIVYNNNSYGILDEYMVKRYGLPNAMDLVNPDFVGLARSFGIESLRVETPDELGKVLKKETVWTKPLLIEFSYPTFPPPWEV